MNELTLTEGQGTAALADHAGGGNSSATTADWSDVAEFNTALNPGQNLAATTGLGVAPHADVQSLLSGLQSVSSRLQARNKAIDKALLKSSQSLDPQDMWKVSKEMSEMYLETSLATKVIGKVEQTIDQLTRLQ